MSEQITSNTSAGFGPFEYVSDDRRSATVTEHGRYQMEALGLSDARIAELMAAVERYRYDGAVTAAERLVAAGPARVRQTVYGEWLTLNDMYDFGSPARTDGQCSELAWKLRQDLTGAYNASAWASSWLERVNREQHRRGDDELGLYVLVGCTPTHFTPEYGSDSPHFWLGLATKRDAREYQESPYEPEEDYDEYDESDGESDEYDTEDDGYENDSYEDDNVRYRRDWDPFLHIDPAFNIVAAEEDGYKVSDVMEGWTAPDDLSEGCYVAQYSFGDNGLKTDAACPTLRQSQDGSVIFGVGFARENGTGPMSPCVSLLHSDSSLDFGVRTPDGSYAWSNQGMAVTESARQEAEAVLDVLAKMPVIDTV